LPVARVQEKLRIADRQVKRLAKLIDTLLDVSRLQSRRMQYEFSESDFSRMVEEVAQRFAHEAEIAGCKLTVKTVGSVKGHWDRQRLEQVLENLLTNAIKFGNCQPVEISLEAANGRAQLKVRDHGIGIATNDQQRIFERFEQAVSPRNYGGLGLGLYIVKEIVNAHQGTISIASELGKGTTFTVDLPC